MYRRIVFVYVIEGYSGQFSIFLLEHMTCARLRIRYFFFFSGSEEPQENINVFQLIKIEREAGLSEIVFDRGSLNMEYC